MIDFRGQQIAAMFKPVPGGYVFRVPFPLALYGTPRFLVTEEQKAQLSERIVPTQPLLLGVILGTALIAAVVFAAATVFWLSPNPNPTVADTAAMVAIVVVIFVAALFVLRSWQQRRVAPIMAQLKPTDIPFTLKEAKAAVANAMSTGQLKFVLACTVFTMLLVVASGAFGVARGQTAGYFQLATGVIFAGLTVYWTRQLIARKRAESVGG